MKKTTVLIILIILNHFLQAQPFDWKTHEVKNDSDLLKTSIYISLNTIPLTNGFWHYGVGFFYYSIRNKKLYLVTNRHVLKGLDTIVMVVKRKNSYLNDDFTIFPSNNLSQKTKLFNNPSDTTDEDLALIDLSMCGFDPNEFNFKAFTENNLVNNLTQKKIPLGAKIININYLLGVEKIPFFVTCFLATPYFIDFRNNKEFCVSGNIIQGCSGSPIVFKSEQNKYYLLGIDRFGYTEPSGQLLFINSCIKSSQITTLIDF